jgi:hypothetical protein
MTTHETARRLMPFQDSKNRIERARFLAGEFQARIEGGQTDNLGAVLRGFVRELRAALDSAIADIARVRAKDPEGAVFPFADNAQKLAHLCDVEFRGIDEELAEYLKRLRPYKDGHPYLHLLRELDSDAACRDFIAANGTAAVARMERIFQAAAETCAELGARFGTRL